MSIYARLAFGLQQYNARPSRTMQVLNTNRFVTFNAKKGEGYAENHR